MTRDVIRNLKNWTLVLFLVKLATRVKSFEFWNYPKDICFLLQNIKKLPLLEEELAQSLLLIEIFISDLIGQFLRKIKKFLKNSQNSKTFFCLKQVVASKFEKIPTIGHLD